MLPAMTVSDALPKTCTAPPDVAPGNEAAPLPEMTFRSAASAVPSPLVPMRLRFCCQKTATPMRFGTAAKPWASVPM